MGLKNMVRIPPVPLSDSIGIAAWLESMALEGMYYNGLFYSRHFLTTILFKDGPPAQVRYRIDPSPGTFYGEPPPGLVELYEEAGWTYVDSPGRFCHIFMSQDIQAVEPYDSPQSLGQAVESQLSVRKKGLFLAAFLFALNVLLLIYLLITRYRTLEYRLALLILLGLALVFSVLNLWQIVQYKKQLDQGRHPSYPSKQYNFRMVGLVLFGILYALIDIYLIIFH